jgi:hypothetical protein
MLQRGENRAALSKHTAPAPQGQQTQRHRSAPAPSSQVPPRLRGLGCGSASLLVLVARTLQAVTSASSEDAAGCY